MTSASAPVKPMRADARRNYDKIVSTAAEAFRESGIDASLDEIAKRAGVGPGTLYRHFPTRETLIAAAMRQETGRLLEFGDRDSGVGEGGASGPGEKLIDWLAALSRHVASYQGLPEVITAAARDRESPLFTSCSDLRNVGAGLLASAQEAGEIRADLTVDEVFTLANMVALGESCVESRRLLALAVEGIRPRADS
ncbi:TetR/AcrR family transcriptional regulator [Gordonia soli]|uniref:Putative TetR family transcriptional regulator n=1 Tax=Gordonia soli NBRC 108243 TaxID=1223545 RepID=M0QDI4_9ACTN|nr:TetR/AcrR family transcriptional regulator [Gordonia soli]GAC66499.1 putative TetR family transcriptional regulator [Gordonia soli NBRC 108243]